MHHLAKSSLKLAALPALVCLTGIYGCAGAVIGAGAAAGVGTYSYFSGKLTKTYEFEYRETVRASRSTLEKLQIPITDTIADGLKTEFKAKRADETPVAVDIVMIDRDHTQVSVRTGSLGIWDRRVSEQIHGYINEALTLKDADDEKPLEDYVEADAQPAEADAQPTIVEEVQPGIIEEDLAEASGPASVQAATTADRIFPDSANVIFFERGSNALTDAATEKLDRISEILINNPEAVLELNGYSDSFGAPSYNQRISEIRADVVKSYLVGKGIDPSRILALGHGAQKFIASNKTAEGRRMNRRVEIDIIKPKTVE
jgi:outer membrane protein OmpA-like peptidoglycan-associated protein